MKTLRDICVTYPLLINVAKVQFECTSDYDHFAGRRNAKWYVGCSLTTAMERWKHSLEFVEKREQIHKYTNDGLIRENATDIAAKASEELKKCIPDLERIVCESIEKEASNKIEKGEASIFIHTEIEHQTIRLVQVYVPAYHAEFAGQVIDVPAEKLWENPNY